VTIDIAEKRITRIIVFFYTQETGVVFSARCNAYRAYGTMSVSDMLLMLLQLLLNQ